MTSDLAHVISDFVLLQFFVKLSKYVMVTSNLSHVIFKVIRTRCKIMCCSLCNQSSLLCYLIYVGKFLKSKLIYLIFLL